MIRIIIKMSALAIVTLCVPAPSNAQEAAPPVNLKPLSQQVAARFDQTLAEIAIQKEDITRIEEQNSDLEGVPVLILGARRDRLWTSMFQKTLALARDVSLQEDRGMDVSAYRGNLVRELEKLPDEAYGAMQRLRDRVVFPSDELAPEEFVVADQKLFKILRDLDDIFRALTSYVEIAGKFDLDA